MKDLLVLLAHLLATLAKLLGPGGTRSVVADSKAIVELAKTYSVDVQKIAQEVAIAVVAKAA